MKDQRSRHNLELCEVTGKKSHPDYHSAARHMKRIAQMNRESVDFFNVYQCEHCERWHIGHNGKGKAVRNA